MGGYPREALVAMLTLSIIASSLFVGYENYTYATGQFPDISINAPGQMDLGISSSPFATKVIGQDYTSNTGYNPNITVPSTWTVLGAPLWTQEDTIGYVVTNTPLYPLGEPAILFIANELTDSNGDYDNTYYVNNSVNQPFYLCIYATGQGSGISIPAVSRFAKFTDEGIHLQQLSTAGFGMDSQTSVLYPDADVTGNTVKLYETKYNPSTDILTVYIDGNLAGTFNQVTKDQFTGYTEAPGQGDALTAVSWGGSASYTHGFTIQQIKGLMTTTAINGVTNNGVFGLIGVLGIILGFNTGALIPVWAFFLIFSCQFVPLIYMGAELIRGD